MKKVVILKKITSDNEDLLSTFFNHFSLSLNRKKHMVMGATRKKLKLLIYRILE